jgi:hypothetical protein
MVQSYLGIGIHIMSFLVTHTPPQEVPYKRHLVYCYVMLCYVMLCQLAAQGLECKRIKGPTSFEHYLLIFRRRFTNGTWCIACGLCQLAAPGLECKRIKGHYKLRALLANLQEALHKRHLVYCVRVMSVGCTRTSGTGVGDTSSTPYTGS